MTRQRERFPSPVLAQRAANPEPPVPVPDGPLDEEGWCWARLGERDFRRLSTFIEQYCGIRMPESKWILVETRLRKRLRALGLGSFSQYCDYAFLSADSPREQVHLIDAITTNKTDFFREPQQLELFAHTVLPGWMETSGAGIRRPLEVWSAGCASGEEPYTLSMLLHEHGAQTPGFDFRILATDISTQVLQRAVRAVYPEHHVKPIPELLRRKYLLRSKDRRQALVRIAPEVRQKVSFQRLNLVDANGLGMARYDFIFCRNVMIYFDGHRRAALVRRFREQLRPGGYLFLGLAETLNGLDTGMELVASSIYRQAPT